MSLLDRPILIPAGVTARSLRRALSLTGALALMVVAILLPVVQSSDEAAQGYRIRALEQQKADLDAQIYGAQADLAQLGSLTRIDAEARDRLGMAPVSRELSVSVSEPPPATHPLPNRFLPPEVAQTADLRESRWQKLLHLLRIS